MSTSNFAKAKVIAQTKEATTYQLRAARGHVAVEVPTNLIEQLDHSKRLRLMLKTLLRKRAREISDETIKITPQTARLYE